MSKDLESAFHKTIKKVSSDIEETKFNTAIAAMMGLINTIYAKGSITKDELEIFIKLLSPFAPHLTEEIWAFLGNEGFLSVAKWPEYDEAKTVDDEIEVAVQVNGKTREVVKVSKDIDKDGAINAGKEAVSKWLEGATIVKEIYIPGKIVNIVIKK